MHKIIPILPLLILLNEISPVSGQNRTVYNDQVFNRKIKTVQLFKEGWNLSNPLMKLASNEKLVLSFDQLGDEPVSYNYSFIHCNKGWQKSDLNPTDYLEGFPENQIEKYDPSFNTKINYYHYSAVFPNERVNFKFSGNYIIVVYPAGDPDNPVLTRRFMVTEDVASVVVSVDRPQLNQYYKTGQQVDFTVKFTGLSINDPYHDVSSFILKNGQWTNIRSDLSPDIAGNNEVIYNSLSNRNIFAGGNEFRYFDIRSITYQSEFVRKIDFIENSYHVFLKPSENREFKPYFYSQDFNGKYYIALADGRNMDTEADYLYVYFTLPSMYKISGGKMYVSGALNNWAFNEENIMTYDPDKAEYQCTMLLKQGWYNYEYIFIKDGDQTGEPSLFEGNHYETENDYLILVYYRSVKERYDRLIGSALVNSIRKGNN